MGYTSVFSGLPAVLIGLYRRSFNTAIIKWAFFYVLGSLVIDVTSSMLNTLFNLHNLITINSWQVIKIFTVTAFYYSLSSKKWNIPSLTFASVVLITILLEGFTIKHSFYGNMLGTIIGIGLGFHYFYNLYKNETEIFIEDSVTFWIACAFFFNGTGSFFSYLLSQQILTDRATFEGWVVFVTINIATNFIIAFALWKAPALGNK
ncbi:hypothetical protein [Roseivirga pacifica]|uniref:hypothetical protein n=1 Tax=Roseivirga pacifica TaxID=1267423 RepID=UPI0011133388|nr:hypothetical protein [Roseivirga pacifica]